MQMELLSIWAASSAGQNGVVVPEEFQALQQCADMLGGRMAPGMVGPDAAAVREACAAQQRLGGAQACCGCPGSACSSPAGKAFGASFSVALSSLHATPHIGESASRVVWLIFCLEEAHKNVEGML